MILIGDFTSTLQPHYFAHH